MQAIEAGVPRNRRNLRAMRKKVDELITVDQKLIQRILPTFLAGKKPSFSIEQIKEMVKEARTMSLNPEGPYS